MRPKNIVELLERVYPSKIPIRSQYGECIILSEHFATRKKGYFVDIGAADGIRYSNTNFLIEKGWSGLLVEPCQHFVTTLQNNNEKNNDVSIYAGAVSNYNGMTNLHVFASGEHAQASTIVETLRNEIENEYKQIGTFTDCYSVQVVNPEKLLKMYNAPKKIDFVDIDAEGSDFKILNAWPWDKYEVEIFCVEFSMGKILLQKFMNNKGYVLLAQTEGNHIYWKYDAEKINEFLNTKKFADEIPLKTFKYIAAYMERNET